MAETLSSSSGDAAMTPEEFRAARERLGLSAHGLARKLGVHPRTVFRWQDGTQPIPGPVAAALRAYMQAKTDSAQSGVHLIEP